MDSSRVDKESEISIAAAKALFEARRDFCRVLLDGYVVVHNSGKILSFNENFSVLTGISKELIVLSESIAEVIRIEINGEQIKLPEFLNTCRQTRVDEVRGMTGKTLDHRLILSTYPLEEGSVRYGCILLIRDVTEEANLQAKYEMKSIESITDALTKLYNRSRLQTYIDSESRKPSIDAVYIMLDIDHFKKTNDDFGHLAGDYIITEIASILKNLSRPKDLLFRYGGEEFLIIHPCTSLEESLEICERFRSYISNFKFEFESQLIPTSISLGVSLADHGNEPLKAISDADKCLYHAKKSGRNIISLSAQNEQITYAEWSKNQMIANF